MITRPTHVTFLLDEDTQQIAGYIDRNGRQRDMTGALLGGDPIAPVGLVSKADLPSQIATFAALPASPAGLYLVLADETKGGAPTLYLFKNGARYWVAMVQDA